MLMFRYARHPHPKSATARFIFLAGAPINCVCLDIDVEQVRYFESMTEMNITGF